MKCWLFNIASASILIWLEKYVYVFGHAIEMLAFLKIAYLNKVIDIHTLITKYEATYVKVTLMQNSVGCKNGLFMNK